MINSDITCNGLLNVTSTGTFVAGSGTAIVNGDLTNSGSLTSTGVTTFTGTTVQTIRFLNAIVSNSAGVINFSGSVSPVLNSTSTPTYAPNLNINNTAGVPIPASTGWCWATSPSAAALFSMAAHPRIPSGETLRTTEPSPAPERSGSIRQQQ